METGRRNWNGTQKKLLGPLCGGMGEGSPVQPFQNSIKIKKVTIESCAETIGEYAFKECTALEGIDWSQATALRAIGEYECKSMKLVSAVLPSSLETIGQCAFRECTALEKIDLGQATALKEIGEHVFDGCASLTVIFGNNIGSAEIGRNAFNGCKVKVARNLNYFKDVFTFTEENGLKGIDLAENSNLALALRLKVLHPDATNSSLPLSRLISMYSLNPLITESDLLEPKMKTRDDETWEKEQKLLKTVANCYIQTTYELVRWRFQNDPTWYHL